jgi:hypothetical protein
MTPVGQGLCRGQRVRSADLARNCRQLPYDEERGDMISAQRVLLDHSGANGSMTRHVRGSLLASSLHTLRELGYYDRYLFQLPERYREPVLFALASSWLPLEVADAHYQACDDLELSDSEIVAIGEAVAKRIMGTFLGTLFRTGRGFGAAPTPWLVLGQYHRVCERIIDGGKFTVFETGPKDAIVQTRGLSLFRSRYFRTATLGMFRGGVGMFAKSCIARELPERSSRDSLTVSLRWV